MNFSSQLTSNFQYFKIPFAIQTVSHQQKMLPSHSYHQTMALSTLTKRFSSHDITDFTSKKLKVNHQSEVITQSSYHSAHINQHQKTSTPIVIVAPRRLSRVELEHTLQFIPSAQGNSYTVNEISSPLELYSPQQRVHQNKKLRVDNKSEAITQSSCHFAHINQHQKAPTPIVIVASRRLSRAELEQTLQSIPSARDNSYTVNEISNYEWYSLQLRAQQNNGNILSGSDTLTTIQNAALLGDFYGSQALENLKKITIHNSSNLMPNILCVPQSQQTSSIAMTQEGQNIKVEADSPSSPKHREIQELEVKKSNSLEKNA